MNGLFARRSCAGMIDDGAHCVDAACTTSADCAGSLFGVRKQLLSCGEDASRIASLPKDAPCRIANDCASLDPVLCFNQGDKAQTCNINIDFTWACGELYPCGVCG